MLRFNITCEEQFIALSKLKGYSRNLAFRLNDISVSWMKSSPTTLQNINEDITSDMSDEVVGTYLMLGKQPQYFTFKPNSEPDEDMVREYILSRVIAESLQYTNALQLAETKVVLSNWAYVKNDNVISIHIANGVANNKLILPIIEFMPGVHVDDISDELIKSSLYQGIFKTDNLEEFEFLVDKKNAVNVQNLIQAYTNYFSTELAFKDPAEPAVAMYQFIDRTEVYFSFEGYHPDVEEVLFTIKITRYNQQLNSTTMQAFLKNPMLPYIRSIEMAPRPWTV